MLTHHGIKANSDKFQTIINMRSPTSVKEVQQLTCRLAALSQFISCAGDKSIHLFVAIKISAKFIWTEECQKVFVELKQFLSAPAIWVKPKENSTLILYLEVSEKAVNSVLVQDDDGEERSVYFISKVLKGAEFFYQKIERLTLAVLVTAMKIKQYF